MSRTPVITHHSSPHWKAQFSLTNVDKKFVRKKGNYWEDLYGEIIELKILVVTNEKKIRAYSLSSNNISKLNIAKLWYFHIHQI